MLLPAVCQFDRNADFGRKVILHVLLIGGVVGAKISETVVYMLLIYPVMDRALSECLYSTTYDILYSSK